MSLTLKKSWALETRNGYYRTVTATNGFRNDTIQDNRPLPRHTPKARWRPPTPYYRRVDTGDIYTYQCVVYYEGYDPRVGTTPDRKYYYSFNGASNVSGYYYTGDIASPSDNMENKAIVKARLKLKNQKVNLPQVFGERRQTIRLVGQTLTELTRMVHNVKRLKPGRYLRNDVLRQDAFFSRWLEYQYGWKPLLMDVHGAVSALHEHEKESGPPIVTVKAVVRETDRRVIRKTDTQSGSLLIWDFDKIIQTEHKGLIRLDFTQSDQLFSGPLTTLGITNPLEVAWELLPWSFVADWFIPIGDYLSSLDATVGWVFKGGSYSVKSTEKTAARNFSVRDDPYIKVGVRKYAYGTASGRRMQFTRTVYNSAPLPTLPDFSKLTKSSPHHLANGIALLMSAIVGGSRVR